MPVTIRLSKLLNDRLGEEVTDELVDWFNKVDATYRAELRELNELNFARFDAKLEQRTAELRAEFREGLEGLREQLAHFEARIERRLGDQTRWFFAAWATLFLAIVGLWMRR